MDGRRTDTLDPDTRAMSDALTRALADSGMTQAQFAAALGTSAPRFSTYRTGKKTPTATFFLRALRLADALKRARAAGTPTPLSAAAQVRDALADGDSMWALRTTLQARDRLRDLLDAGAPEAEAWEAAPSGTGDDAWDALLAALTEHEFTARKIPAPKWTSKPLATRELLLLNPLLGEDRTKAETPAWLARRGVFICERDLVTA